MSWHGVCTNLRGPRMFDKCAALRIPVGFLCSKKESSCLAIYCRTPGEGTAHTLQLKVQMHFCGTGDTGIGRLVSVIRICGRGGQVSGYFGEVSICQYLSFYVFVIDPELPYRKEGPFQNAGPIVQDAAWMVVLQACRPILNPRPPLFLCGFGHRNYQRVSRPVRSSIGRWCGGGCIAPDEPRRRPRSGRVRSKILAGVTDVRGGSDLRGFV